MKTEEMSPTNASEILNKHLVSNDKLIEQIPLEGTPFHATKRGDEWYLTFGRYRLTDNLGSLEKVKHDAGDASWFRIMQIMGIVIEEYIETGDMDNRIRRIIRENDDRANQLSLQLNETINRQENEKKTNNKSGL